jgi:hypothetical protein
MYQLGMRKPLFTISKKVDTLCRLPFVRSIQSFEVDENLILFEMYENAESYSDQLKRVTHLRLSLCNFKQFVNLLSQLGSQLHSFIVTMLLSNKLI